ncbi:hypothetical protein T492DRAFT_398389 [Pavlovales sp. CCMP2436]|nr:hypothetical protein T492DRAFT_398389 [Pavlovales sp. CCMP2436]
MLAGEGATELPGESTLDARPGLLRQDGEGAAMLARERAAKLPGEGGGEMTALAAARLAARVPPPRHPTGWAVFPTERFKVAFNALKRLLGFRVPPADGAHGTSRKAFLSRVKRQAERFAHSVFSLARHPAGSGGSRQREPRRMAAGVVDKPRPWRVRVHVYQLVSNRTNRLIRMSGLGGGVYHTGVEIGGVEYGCVNI